MSDAPPPPPPPPEFLALRPALADRYALKRAIGEGGMATVYLAQDLKHDRAVALKVLHPELAAVIGEGSKAQRSRVSCSAAEQANALLVHDDHL